MPEPITSGNVVVTSFGPFCGYKTNPSVEIASLLTEMDPFLGDTRQLITECLPVEYDAVAKRVPELWDLHKPIHTNGVIYLEQQSYNRGYCKADNKGDVPSTNVCCHSDCSFTRSSKISCQAIVDAIALKLPKDTHLRVQASNDPGRYLCAFSYFLSLNRDENRCLFVHVCPPDRHVTNAKQADMLKLVILECIRQLESS